MSALFAVGVSALYVGGIFGLHRLNVWRMRRASGDPAVLRWLEWDTLLEGLLPPAQADEPRCPPVTPLLPDRAPPPECLNDAPLTAQRRRDALLILLQWPDAGGLPKALDEAGFNEDERTWLQTLVHARTRPSEVLERLSGATSVREVYLREHLTLLHETTPLNLELVVFGAKRRLREAMRRHGEHPALFFVRGLASSLVGFNQAAVDDLARAVYFSREKFFYVEAVLRTPYIEDVRPTLTRQCHAARARSLEATRRQASAG